MGTRGAIGFRLEGNDHVTYNHNDSGPGYLGVDVVSFLHDRAQVEGHDGLIGGLKQQVRSLVPIDASVPPTEHQKAWCKSLDLLNTNVSTGSEDDWFCLLYNAQGNVERTLQARFFEPSQTFLLDSLFCEYAYLINLDEETLEFYTGFQPLDGKRHEGRYWASIPENRLSPFEEEQITATGDKYMWETTYGPVVLKLTVPLHDCANSAPSDVAARMKRLD